MRRVDAITGLISTIAGTGTAAFSGDNGPATAAEIDKPLDVAVDMQNNIYFGDYNNNRIRKISAVTTNTTSMQKLNPVIDVYPNPSNGIINIQWSHLESSDSKIEITDVLGRIVYQKGIVIDPTNNKIKIELTNFENGIYWLKLNANGVSYNHCITILK